MRSDCFLLLYIAIDSEGIMSYIYLSDKPNSNILSLQVKIGDFGLSRALGLDKDYYQSKYRTDLKIPIAW